MRALLRRPWDNRRKQSAQPAHRADLFRGFRRKRLARQISLLSRCGQFGKINLQIERIANRSHNRRRFRQSSGAKLAAGHRAFIRVQHGHSRLAQPSSIALGRLVLPHPYIHGRHRQNRLVGCQDQRRRQIIRNPCRHFGHEICRSRANHHQISLARQLDMAHFHLILEVEKRGIDLVFTQSRKRHRRHKLLSALGDDAGHFPARLADHADQFAGFVRRNTAANDQENTRAAHLLRPWLQSGIRLMRCDWSWHSHCFIPQFLTLSPADG